MTSAEFKRWLTKQGCAFEPGHGGHLTVRLGRLVSTLPMHGKQKDLGKGQEMHHMLDYPVTFTRDDNDTILVGFPDFPEAHTFGEDVPEALHRAQDALATVIDAYIRDRRDIPAPSVRGKYRVAAPARLVAKTWLYETMRRAKINKSQLAKRMKVHLPQVDRLLNVHHGSTVEQLEAAFESLGKRLVVAVEDMPTSPKAPRRKARKARVVAHA